MTPEWFSGSRTQFALLREVAASAGISDEIPLHGSELQDDARETLIEAVGDELVRSGFGPGDVPNGRGHLLEDLIDILLNADPDY